MAGEMKEVICEQAILGESPVWDEQSQLFYWVDILGQYIHEYSPKTKRTRSIKINQMPGAVAPSTKPGKLIGALQHGFYSVDFDTSLITPIFDPEEHKPNNRFNDGKCDPAGRFWAGTISLTREPEDAALYCLDSANGVQKKWSPVTTSNGLAWNKNKQAMYYIDTPTQSITQFDYSLADGSIHDPKAIIDFSKEHGKPDGMTIDADGNLWIAHFEGGRVSCWNPDTGKKQEELILPASLITSCTFGGESLTDLYITTARNELTEEEQKKEPLAGYVFSYSLGVKGLPADHFMNENGS